MNRALAATARRHRRHLAVVPPMAAVRRPTPAPATETFEQRHWTQTLAAAGLNWDSCTTPAAVVDALMPELERLVGFLAHVREGGIPGVDADPNAGVDATGAVAVIGLFRDVLAAAHPAVG